MVTSENRLAFPHLNWSRLSGMGLAGIATGLFSSHRVPGFLNAMVGRSRTERAPARAARVTITQVLARGDPAAHSAPRLPFRN
jgi:hypothetical protein